MTTFSVCLFSAVAMTVTASFAAPNARPLPQQARKAATVPAEVSVSVANSSYKAKGPASCTHAPTAGIYGIRSEMWTVRHQEDGRSLQLTLWKPRDGSSSMFSFSMNGPAKSTVSTVRGGQPSGTGSVTLTPADKGGTFTIEAKDKAGQPIKGTIRCEAFTRAVAEGGD